ncbi:Zinc finger AN1 domain-containing stress-associated protein 12 [Olea europaea subsp. europaea]|uniref:Zinc finger AN1 domain-containing stress-associated protein 12 n=1 Tax=Olea europaea subsp. europaea TaxID=158383 RepID=A0A8S0VPG4_OLEEU|nr:Zinc finger AN1 domain-containing stress-associated protein 12 [Olea europaea subsp. europaea]
MRDSEAILNDNECNASKPPHLTAPSNDVEHHVDAGRLPLDRPSNVSRIKETDAVPEPTSQPQSKLLKSVWEVPPPGCKMPHLKSFKLTKELVQQRVKNNVVVVTFGNFAFMDFTLTWVKHLTDLGVDNLLVGNFLSILIAWKNVSPWLVRFLG